MGVTYHRIISTVKLQRKYGSIIAIFYIFSGHKEGNPPLEYKIDMC